jgi:hypothetical protein
MGKVDQLRALREASLERPAAVNTKPVQLTPAVNKPELPKSRRGTYPATDKRRAYMRDYMAKKRAVHG